jgi:hypothetical protein
MGLITLEDVGYNGITKRDVGKWWILCPKSNVMYYRKSEQDARELYNILRGAT